MGSDVNEVLQQAMEFYVAGHTVEARALLLDLVRAHPALEAGWMFLSYTLEDPIQKADCLRQVLKLNPQNSEAKSALEELVSPPEAEPQPAAEPQTAAGPRPVAEPRPAAPAPTHASPFIVDISHANDELPAGGNEPPAIPLKVVSAFSETPAISKSPAAPAPVPVPPAPVNREASPTAVRPPAPGVVAASAATVQSQPSTVRATPPNEELPAASKKSAPAPAKSGPPPAAAGEQPKPKKRGNVGCTCLVIAVIAILLIAAIGAWLLWRNGYLPGLMAVVQPTVAATEIPSPTDTPVILTLPPRWTDTPPPTITYTPTITPTPTQTPSPTLVPPDETQQASIAKVEKQVEDLRGLQWDGSLPIYVVSRDQAENILQSELDQSGYVATIGDQQKVLVALGLIVPTYDLAKYALSRLADGVLGFYVPLDRTIYVIGSGFSGMGRWTFSHEFDHALVHHYFPAVGMMDSDPACVNDSQRCEAVRALVEGDATLLMYQWYNQYATPSDKLEISQYRLPFGVLLEDNPPPYVTPDVDFSYTSGMNFVYSLWQKGNWAGVNQAYGNLPVSTEQILHPDKYLKGEAPVVMTVPDLSSALGDKWKLVGNDSLGEFMTYLLLAYGADNLSQIPQNDALIASAGWGGDHYLVFASSSGDQSLLAAEWNWDTDKDATEFLASITNYLNKRFRGEKVDQPGLTCWTKNNQTACLYHKYKNTLWILAPDLGTVNTVLASYPAYS
jgi:hypothetical protein